MVLPFRGTQDLSQIIRDAIIRKELETLTDDVEQFKLYRDYYDGDQPLVYSTDTFRRIFGAAFEGFKDNWMGPIVEVVLDKLSLQGIGSTEDGRDSAQKVWDVFKANEIPDEEADNLHEGAMVESKAFMVVWEDTELGATMDWQPAGLMRVRYDSDRRRKRLWALKRWQVETGEIYVSIYTDRALYKFIETENPADDRGSSSNALEEIPGIGYVAGLQRREVENERWPLPHNFGVVPVVEFNNIRYRSELTDAIPQQDALNKVLLDQLVASEFMAVPQRILESMGKAPTDGWRTGAGEIWDLTPGLDAEGKPVKAQWGEFNAADPTNFIRTVEMYLQHIAFNSRTPVRYFLQSDRGGRGDAPSGEALQVEDKPLNDKTGRKARTFGNRWMEVARLVATVTEGAEPKDLVLGQAIWDDPRYDSRLLVLEEAFKAREAGFPFKYIVRNMGLTPEEVEEIEMWKAEEEAEEEARKQAEMEAAAAAQPDPPANNSA